MLPIAESELIINARGAVYHLDLRPEELADTVITVGDPDRVEQVSRHFDHIEHRQQHREFISRTGRIGKKRITVISSGIGPDNIDIVLNELDALANIDLETRTIRESHRRLDIIRVGTSGSLQKDVPVDSFVASTHGLGIDNLMHFYRPEYNEEERQIRQAFVTFTQMHNHASEPYVCSGSPALLKHFIGGFIHGITVTCPGFYGPQGRVLRLGLALPDLNDQLTDFRFGRHRITNFEMETSAIYGLGKLLGHRTLSLSAIVANRVDKTFSKDPAATVTKLISDTLSHLVKDA
jgi:uridine phosphorylase